MSEKVTTKAKTETNPLLSYTRRETVFVKLPSQGNFYNSEDLALTPSGEIGVRSMTAADEITLNSPEALLNNNAISTIIMSCCPAVKNADNLLAPDIDTLLIAIRKASYGDNMEISTMCPNSECGKENSFEIPLDNSLGNITLLENSYKIELSEACDNMIAYIKPYNMSDVIKDALLKYNETLALQRILNKNMDDLKQQKEYRKHINKIADLNIELLSNNIIKITDHKNQEIESSKKNIAEWISSLPAKDAKLLQSKITEINNIGVDKKFHATCQYCEHEWETNVEFNPSNFFG